MLINFSDLLVAQGGGKKGINNSITDAISHFNMQMFRELAPQADTLPLPIPQQLWLL